MGIYEADKICKMNCTGNRKCKIGLDAEQFNKKGYSASDVYQVFEGIQLIYTDEYSDIRIKSIPISENVIQISHCREGRMECHFRNEFCYISSGDLLIACANDIQGRASFPTGHYRGISVLINIEQAPKCLSCFLDDVKVRPKNLAEKFCGVKSCFVSRANPSFEHIFSELYSVPKEIQKGYFKIKVLELLLFLSVLNTEMDEFVARSIPETQVALAKSVSDYLSKHMGEKVTLERLSAHFHISGTYIKNSFKEVYGLSLYAYIRTQKMEAAAYILEHTEKSVLEIAGEYGYDNASKFAVAFREVKGMTPSQYRNRSKESFV